MNAYKLVMLLCLTNAILWPWQNFNEVGFVMSAVWLGATWLCRKLEDYADYVPSGEVLLWSKR